MCGYCYEGIMLHVVETSHRGTKGYRFCYLQESDDIKSEIQQLEDPNNPEPLIDLAFCRLYDHYFEHGFDVELFDILQTKFGYEAIQTYFSKRQTSSSVFTVELSDINLLSDAACWNRFITDKERILKNSLGLLNFYHDWWLLGISKEKSEPLQRMEQTGIMDPIDNTTFAEWNRFDALYPAIFFALSYIIINHHSNAGIIRRIALTNLEDVPDMWGKDLWLQRRAMIACVKRTGLSFITENLSQIRYELIYYVLLKTDTNSAELNKLKEAILAEDEHPMQGMMESEHIIGLMEKLVA